MGGNSSPRNRGVNVGVRFDLSRFTTDFFALFGTKASYNGPGPCNVQWHSSTTTATERFAIDYLCEEVYSKFDDGIKTPEKKSRALQRFTEGETLCALTNFKFSPLPSGQPPAWLEDPGMLADWFSREDQAVFSRARSIISKILGAFVGWERVLELADFGPGATTRLKRRDGHRSNKWAGCPHVTSTSASLLEMVYNQLPLLFNRIEYPRREIVMGNKLDWVPKNYKTDRTICIEADWNMFLQKGLGAWIRRRLKRVGQDLDDQSVNRFLAALGSITRELATLDLSMASDTVSYRLVQYLIRPDWFDALNKCRSSVGFYTASDGTKKSLVFEKFSSMGNGFTFELESLIFYGLLRAVSELSEQSDHRLYVYGDDIVIPTGMADLAMTYLKKAGFMPNPDKSFSSGPFRESCGGHYFSGTDVTPFYVREPVNNLDRLFLLHNNVYRWLNRHPGICDPDAAAMFLQWIRSHAPEKWQRPRLLSEDVGDGAFIGVFDEVCPKPAGRSKKRTGWEGWVVQTLQYRLRKNMKPAAKGLDAQKGRNPDEYPEKSGPDLASLWSLEKREYIPSDLIDVKQVDDRTVVRQPFKIVDFFHSPLEQLDRWCGNRTGSEVPLSEREWYVGTQVLPWKAGDRWW